MKSTETIREFVHCAEKLRNIANKIDLFVLRYEDDRPLSENRASQNKDLGLGHDLHSALQKLEMLTQNLRRDAAAQTEAPPPDHR